MSHLALEEELVNMERAIQRADYQAAAMRSVLTDIKDNLSGTLTASLLYKRIVNALEGPAGKETLERELELRSKK